ncbi:hypothetical protein NF212_11085 [Parasalinivibrio latis]
MVIVILGILSVTAAPKFLDFSSDARRATVKGFHGAMSAQVSMLNATAMIAGKSGDNVTVQTDFGPYQFWRGYPETKSESTNPNRYFIQTFINLGTPTTETADNSSRQATHGDVNIYENNTLSRIGYGTGNLDAGKCYAQYLHTGSTEAVTYIVDGC